MIYIDYKDRRPVYEQIVERYQELVVDGVLEADTPIPSVRTQAMELSINPNTIQRAYSEMERRGIIYSIKGKGSFIAPSDAIVEKRKREIVEQVGKLGSEAYRFDIDKAVLLRVINKAYPEEVETAGQESNTTNRKKPEGEGEKHD